MPQAVVRNGIERSRDYGCAADGVMSQGAIGLLVCEMFFLC